MIPIRMLDRRALPFRAKLDLAGLQCCLATNSEEILSNVSRWSAETSVSTIRPIEIEVVVDLSFSRRLPLRAHFRGLRHLVFATFGDQELFTFDLLRGRVIGVVSRGTAQDAAFWNTQLLPILVGVMGTTAGVVPLHSACLDRDGKGLLIAGISGAGKSTLSVALAQRGFSLISDDWTYVSYQEGTVGLVAAGLGVPVKLLPDAVEHFPELNASTPRPFMNGEVAFEVDVAKVFHARVKRNSRPHWLMFLERDTQPGCTFIPCEAAEAEAFYERSAELLPKELPQATLKRSEIIRAVTTHNCLRVRSGETPQKTAQAIEMFCERA